MEVKGTLLHTIPIFIKEKFGEESYQTWLNALPPESNKYFKEGVLISNWYPAKEGLITPQKKICELFYNGNNKGAWDTGRFSAEFALKGIYKVFVKMGSAKFIIKKASSIMPTFYKPSKMDIAQLDDNFAILRIVEIDEPDITIEHRIGGWIEKALEVSGAKPRAVEIKTSIAKGDHYTDFHLSWD